MKPKTGRLYAFVAALSVVGVLAACAKNLDQTPEGAPLARQITASSQCGFVAPGLAHIDSRRRLEQVADARGMNLTAMDDHDFQREHLLLVVAGRKPTGGHGVALQDSRIRDDVLEVTVEVRSPGADQMVTQALTSPCAVLAVTSEHWTRVRVSGPGFSELSLER